MMSSANQPEPRPISSTGCIQDLVIKDLEDYPEYIKESIFEEIEADIRARQAVGVQKYGTVLQAFNGRNALMDAYQEAIDLVQYLRQVEEEHERDPIGHPLRPTLYSDAIRIMVRLKLALS